MKEAFPLLELQLLLMLTSLLCPPHTALLVLGMINLYLLKSLIPLLKYHTHHLLTPLVNITKKVAKREEGRLGKGGKEKVRIHCKLNEWRPFNNMKCESVALFACMHIIFINNYC